MEVHAEFHCSADDITIQGPVSPFGDMGMSSNDRLPNLSVGNVGMSLNSAEAVSSTHSSLPPPSHLSFHPPAVSFPLASS